MAIGTSNMFRLIHTFQQLSAIPSSVKYYCTHKVICMSGVVPGTNSCQSHYSATSHSLACVYIVARCKVETATW